MKGVNVCFKSIKLKKNIIFNIHHKTKRMTQAGKSKLENELQKLQNEKVRLENELAMIRERLDLSLSAGNLAWWEMNIQTGMVTFNRNKFLMLGYTEEEFGMVVHYTKFMDLVHPDDYEQAMNAMRKHLSGQEDLYEVEYRIQMKNGNYKWFYDRGSITEYDENQRPRMLKGIVFDYTERKRSQEALKESEAKLSEVNQAKDKFFSIIAHDLKSPFTSFIGLTDLLYTNFEIFNNERKLQLIESIHSVAGNTYSLLNNLLEWSRAESNLINIKRQRLQLKPLVDNVIKLLCPNADKKKIKLTSLIPSNLHVVADHYLTDAVFRNLISNAIKFTKEGGFVEINAESDGSVVRAKVTDTGVGIPEKEIKHLFSIEHKYQTPGTSDELGTGLGLIICKEFMEKNQGSIEVSSEEEKGTTFTLVFENI
jgi:PAS domain S-box-containing protein